MIFTNKAGEDIRQTHTLGAENGFRWTACSGHVSTEYVIGEAKVPPGREEDGSIALWSKIFQPVAFTYRIDFALGWNQFLLQVLAFSDQIRLTRRTYFDDPLLIER